MNFSYRTQLTQRFELEDGGTEGEAIAALLHDAVEEQGAEETRAEIRQRFGEQVTAIVDGCTEPDPLPKSLWQERQAADLQQIQSRDLVGCVADQQTHHSFGHPDVNP
jgi:(p)ppGpp synthase/HD superfamily hydrolase